METIVIIGGRSHSKQKYNEEISKAAASLGGSVAFVENAILTYLSNPHQNNSAEDITKMGKYLNFLIPKVKKVFPQSHINPDKRQYKRFRK